MKMNEYQEKAMTTCMPSSENFTYMFANLVGEVGEFASKVAKAVRKGQIRINDDQVEVREGQPALEIEQALVPELQKEAGDILWQLSGLCSVFDWSLEDIARMNLDKLASRQKRNVIDGSGDNR